MRADLRYAVQEWCKSAGRKHEQEAEAEGGGRTSEEPEMPTHLDEAPFDLARVEADERADEEQALGIAG